MNSILEPGDPPLSKEDLAAVQENAGHRLRFYRRRALYSIAALLFSCAIVTPFSAGQPLHDYAEPFGRLFVFLALAMFIASLYFCLLWWGASSGAQSLR